MVPRFLRFVTMVLAVSATLPSANLGVSFGGVVTAGPFISVLRPFSPSNTALSISPADFQQWQTLPLTGELAYTTCATEFTGAITFYLTTLSAPTTFVSFVCGSLPGAPFVVSGGDSLRVFWSPTSGSAFPGESLVSLYFAHGFPPQRMMYAVPYGGTVCGGNSLGNLFNINGPADAATVSIDEQRFFVVHQTNVRNVSYGSSAADSSTNVILRMSASSEVVQISSGVGIRNVNLAGVNGNDYLQAGWWNGKHPEDTVLTAWTEVESAPDGFDPKGSFVIQFGANVVNTPGEQYAVVNGWGSTVPDSGAHPWRVNAVVPRDADLALVFFRVGGSGDWTWTFRTDAPGVSPQTFAPPFPEEGWFSYDGLLSLPAGATFNLSYAPNTADPIVGGSSLFVFFRYAA